MTLTRRSFLATILGSATAAILPFPKWIWTPTPDAPPIVPTALLTVDQILEAFALQVERQMTRPMRVLDLKEQSSRVNWSRNQRNQYRHHGQRQILHNLVLPRTVSHEGPAPDFEHAARYFARRLRDAQFSVPLRRLENALNEGQIVRVTSGLALRGVVYPDQRPFCLPGDQFVLRIDAKVI